MSRYIQDLIDQGENQMLDFKFEISDARKIARTLVAFSNTDGGKLLIGVKDNGKIAGIRSDEEYHMLEAAAELYCSPVIPFKAQKWTILGKTILEVDIARAAKRPCLAQNENERWLAYLRVKDQNLLANRVLMKVWRRKKGKKGYSLSTAMPKKCFSITWRSTTILPCQSFAGSLRCGSSRLKKSFQILLYWKSSRSASAKRGLGTALFLKFDQFRISYKFTFFIV